jgi:hypothetical protein
LVPKRSENPSFFAGESLGYSSKEDGRPSSVLPNMVLFDWKVATGTQTRGPSFHATGANFKNGLFLASSYAILIMRYLFYPFDRFFACCEGISRGKCPMDHLRGGKHGE